jgi:hypothetical protein
MSLQEGKSGLADLLKEISVSMLYSVAEFLNSLYWASLIKQCSE